MVRLEHKPRRTAEGALDANVDEADGVGVVVVVEDAVDDVVAVVVVVDADVVVVDAVVEPGGSRHVNCRKR